MPTMRSAFILWVAAVLGPAHAADVDGSKDHPMVSRYPGQEIRWYLVENFRPYVVPAGPVTAYRSIGEVIVSVAGLYVPAVRSFQQ